MKNVKYVKLCACIVLTALSLISAAASCKLESGGFTLLTGDYSAPVLTDFTLTGENDALMRFSKPVVFSAVQCTRIGQTNTTFSVNTESGEGGTSYILHFIEAVPVGYDYLLEGRVQDAGGSSLCFSLDFYGYNSRVPATIFSEVGPVHAAAQDPKKAKAEFAELYILEDGNIGGMIIQSAYDGVLTDFVLPAAEVKAGSYVSVHMRLFGEKAVSETGDNFALSTTAYSCNVSRDIWDKKADSAKTRLGADDVLLLRTRSGGALADALLYSRSGKTVWTKPLMSEYAADAFESGIWIEGTEPENAVCSDGITAVRTLSRLNVAELAAAFTSGEKAPFAVSASDWKVLSGKNGEKASPGKPNVFAGKVP
ncbi:hypothetical protein H0R92_09890 [Treponema sp. OMZ 840]|uniref:hypothetical protein n=1 Tax=Treponema sp. OMZ 840 TaxID=244313 RepID=UPI003D927C43